jgi:hypothetical protein
MGNYVFDFTPAPGRRGRGGEFGGGAAAAAPTPDASAPEPGSRGGTPLLPFLNAPFVLIINTAPDEYYFATNGNYPFIVSPKAPSDNTAAPATIDRGYFQNGHWVLVHRYNGDDIMGRGYDISGAAAKHLSGSQIPLNARGRGAAPSAGDAQQPLVYRVTFYQYR